MADAIHNRHSTRGVSCDRCGRPVPVADLTGQDGFLRCSICLRSMGVVELNSLNNGSLERLGASFGGPSGVTVWTVPPNEDTRLETPFIIGVSAIGGPDSIGV